MRAPTCTAQGYTSHTCTVCGDNYRDSYTDATGHRYATTVTQPTCSEQGYTTHTCSVCGDSYKDSYINATGHSFGEWQIRTTPTCTTSGEKFRRCSVCNQEENETIPAAGHDFVNDVCSVCGIINDPANIYTYTIANGSVTITGCDGSLKGNITIPSEINGYSVRAIAESAFKGFKPITGVTVPSSVTSIGRWAFLQCDLTYAKVLNKDVNIGGAAFYSAPNGEKRHFYFPEALKYITYWGDDIAYVRLYQYADIWGRPITNSEAAEEMELWLNEGRRYYGYDITPAGYYDDFDDPDDFDFLFGYFYIQNSDIIHWIPGQPTPPLKDPGIDFIDYVTRAALSDVDATVFGTTLQASKEGYRSLNLSDCTLTAEGRKKLALVPTAYQGESAGITAVHANGVDVLANSITLYGDKKDALTIRTYYSGGANTFTLLCDGEELQSNSTGNFTLSAKQLRKGSYSLQQGTVEYPLGIRVATEAKIDVDLDDVFSFHVPQDVPLIGGKPFEFSLAGISLHQWEEDGKVFITFGVEVDSGSSYKSFKDAIDSIAEDYITASDLEATAARFQELNGFHPWQGAASTGCERSASANFCGYCEVSFDQNGDPHITAGQAVFGVTGKIGTEWQTVVGAVPVVLKLDVEAGASATIGFALDEEDAVTLSGSLDITLPKITASAGVGLVKVADLSVYGSLTNTISRDLAQNITTASLTGEMGLSVKILLLSQKFKLWDFLDWEYYSSAPKRGKSAGAKGANSVEEALADRMAEENFTIIRANEGKPAEWLGATGSLRGEKSASTAGLLQNNVYDNAKAQTVTLPNGKRLMVWLADIAERDDYNYTAVVYSLYDPATGWSAPRILSDDGTADFDPVITTDGTRTVVAWCNANTLFTEGVTLEEMASHCEISVAEFDTATGTFGQAVTLTDNEFFDCMPSITIQNGEWAVSWVTNYENDPLEFSGLNVVSVYKEDETILSFSNTGSPILEQSIGLLSSELMVAYIVDSDCDFTTIDDRILCFANTETMEEEMYSWGQHSNLTFAAVDGENCLVWYKDGDLNCISALDEVPQVLLEDMPDGPFSVVSDENKTVLLCAVPNMKNGEDGSNLVAYTYQNDAFVNPEQIVGEDGCYIGSISGYLDENADVRVTYLQKAVTFTQEDLEVTAALYDTAAPTATPPAPIDTTYADLDGDGEINAEDLTVCTQALLLDGDADANNDGVTNILDLIFMKKILQAA